MRNVDESVDFFMMGYIGARCVRRLLCEPRSRPDEVQTL